MLWMRDIIIPFSVGLTLFFFGMEVMRIGLHYLAGKKLEEWLSRFTKSPLIGFLTGTIATAILQSSSAITVITVGLVNARILTFRQSIGIILGTNVGTTVTTQLIAFPIQKLTLTFFMIGLLLWLIPKPISRFSGLTLGGFASLMIGLSTIATLSTPLSSHPSIQTYFSLVDTHLPLGILIGTLLTAIIQSSTAMTAISMAFVKGGLISVAGAISVILGSNIGTCLTAYLASLGGSRAGKLVAYAHILLNLFGVLLFLPFIKLLTLISLYLSDDPARQIAHAQTIFNVITSLLVLPFAYQFGTFVNKLIPNFR